MPATSKATPPVAVDPSELVYLAWKGLPKGERQRVAQRISEALDATGRRSASVPNEETKQALRESEAGVGVRRYGANEEMFAHLGL